MAPPRTRRGSWPCSWPAPAPACSSRGAGCCAGQRVPGRTGGGRQGTRIGCRLDSSRAGCALEQTSQPAISKPTPRTWTGPPRYSCNKERGMLCRGLEWMFEDTSLHVLAFAHCRLIYMHQVHVLPKLLLGWSVSMGPS